MPRVSKDTVISEMLEARKMANICQSEGPRGETICMLPLGHDGPCGWEHGERLGAARVRAVWDTIDALQDGGWLTPQDADHIRATLPSVPVKP